MAREIDAECEVQEGTIPAVVEHARVDARELGVDLLGFLELVRFHTELHDVARNELDPPCNDNQSLQRILAMLVIKASDEARRAAWWEVYLRLRRLEGPHESDLELPGHSMRAEVRKLRKEYVDAQRFARREAPSQYVRDAMLTEVSAARIQYAVVASAVVEVDAERPVVGEEVGDLRNPSGPQPATERRRRWLLPLARRLVATGATWADAARLVVDADLHWVDDPCPFTAKPYRGEGSDADRQVGIDRLAQVLRRDLGRRGRPKARHAKPKARRKTPHL